MSNTRNPYAGAAAIMAASSLLGSAMNSASAASMNGDQMNWQSKQNQYARDWQESMYNKYQSPQALVNQQLQAGVNPFIDGASAAAGTMPNASAATGMPSLHPLDFGVDKAVNTALAAQSVGAQNENYRSQSVRNAIDTIVNAHGQLGSEAGQQVAEMMLPNLDLDGQAIVNKMNNALAMSADVQAQREQFELSLSKQYSAKERQAMLDSVDQQITESVARIGKMSSDAKVNDANIRKVGFECGKLFSESKYYNAMSSQITQLLPYVRAQYLFAAASMGLTFENEHSTFIGDTKKRDYIKSEDGQSRRLWNYQNSPEGNYVNAFIGGFADAVNANVGVSLPLGSHGGSAPNGTTFYGRIR